MISQKNLSTRNFWTMDLLMRSIHTKSILPNTTAAGKCLIHIPFRSGHVYPETWAVDGNTFTNDTLYDPVTLDYIMIKRNLEHKGKVWFDGVSVDDFKTTGTSYSFSDHNAVSADITYFEPCQYA